MYVCSSIETSEQRFVSDNLFYWTSYSFLRRSIYWIISVFAVSNYFCVIGHLSTSHHDKNILLQVLHIKLMNKRKDKKLLWAQSAYTYKTYIKDSLSLSYELIGFWNFSWLSFKNIFCTTRAAEFIAWMLLWRSSPIFETILIIWQKPIKLSMLNHRRIWLGSF